MPWPEAGLTFIYSSPEELSREVIPTHSSPRDFSLGGFIPACNVLFVNSVDMESLTGPQAISKATSETLAADPTPAATIVQIGRESCRERV